MMTEDQADNGQRFKGFPAGKTRMIGVPDLFFTAVLPRITDLDELKLTLFCIRVLDQMGGAIRFIPEEDLLADPVLLESFSSDSNPTPDQRIRIASEKMVSRGTFLRSRKYLFLNSEKGRALWQACEAGTWMAPANIRYPGLSAVTPPNVFKMYEENIGPLTPMIAEILKDAENEFPTPWIQEAMDIAVRNNVRRWRYIEAILRAWKEEGRNEQDRRDAPEDGSRYLKGKYARFIQH